MRSSNSAQKGSPVAHQEMVLSPEVQQSQRKAKKYSPKHLETPHFKHDSPLDVLDLLRTPTKTRESEPLARTAKKPTNNPTQEPQIVEGCQCRRATCLKMTCDCFARGKLCGEGCSCADCKNLNDNMLRSQAINQVITKDPQAFSRKSGIADSADEGCKCVNSKCVMKYCRCFAKGNTCSERCMCEDCKNVDRKKRLIRLRASTARRELSEEAPKPNKKRLKQQRV